jgi:hypothetical protein
MPFCGGSCHKSKVAFFYKAAANQQARLPYAYWLLYTYPTIVAITLSLQGPVSPRVFSHRSQ